MATACDDSHGWSHRHQRQSTHPASSPTSLLLWQVQRPITRKLGMRCNSETSAPCSRVLPVSRTHPSLHILLTKLRMYQAEDPTEDSNAAMRESTLLDSSTGTWLWTGQAALIVPRRVPSVPSFITFWRQRVRTRATEVSCIAREANSA